MCFQGNTYYSVSEISGVQYLSTDYKTKPLKSLFWFIRIITILKLDIIQTLCLVTIRIINKNKYSIDIIKACVTENSHCEELKSCCYILQNIDKHL